MKYYSTQSGLCRVYYRMDNKWLVCFQEDFPGQYTFFICSQDGEPSHEIKTPEKIPLSPGNYTIDKDLNEYLTERTTA